MPPVSAQTRAQAARRGAALALDLLAFDASLAPAMEHAFGRTFICPVRARNIHRLSVELWFHMVAAKRKLPLPSTVPQLGGFVHRLHSSQCWAMPGNSAGQGPKSGALRHTLSNPC